MQTPVMIFDFDGTVADTHHYMVEICNRLAPEFGFDPIPDADIERLRDKSAQELILHLKVPTLKIPAIVARAKRLFHEGIAGVALVDGMHDVLHTLHRRGVQLGILSSNEQQNIETFLRNHDVGVFDFIHSARTIWGKHHSLKKLMRGRHIDPRAVYMSATKRVTSKRRVRRKSAASRSPGAATPPAG